MAVSEDGGTPDGVGRPRTFIELALRERGFLILVGLGFLAVAWSYPYPGIAMWVGFGLAGYAATANDSIQTIGTFIVSNQHRPWPVLWVFISALFVLTVGLSWLINDGDVTWGVLQSKGFSTAPTEFGFLQIAAPLFLIILTRLRMPVSTTFLLLSSFATKVSGVTGVLTKSLSGYVIAFVASVLLWTTLGRWMHRKFTGEPHPTWWAVQWVVSGALWCLWVAQDAANIAVFLPRQLSLEQFIPFAGVIVLGLGLLFYLRGDRIQTIVSEKSAIYDVRAATVIDFLYALILLVFKVMNNVPMSTTWVFIGLLGGRELAYSHSVPGSVGMAKALRMMGRDLLFALIGLLVSLILAASINHELRDRLFGL
ncbi:MAG: hypothetical protein AAGD10_19440 [Myxococcota bacterium]